MPALPAVPQAVLLTAAPPSCAPPGDVPTGGAAAAALHLHYQKRVPRTGGQGGQRAVAEACSKCRQQARICEK